MAQPRTTIDRLVTIYDKTIDSLEAKLDAGTMTTGDYGELRKLLDAATVLQLVKHAQASPTAANAVPVANLPFLAEDCPEAVAR